MKNILIIILIAFLLVGCSSNRYSSQEINNPKSVNLPIDNSEEAIQYSLSLDQVRVELNKPVIVRGADYNKYTWWNKVIKTSYNKKKDIWIKTDFDDTQPVWNVMWFKGPGECESPHGCQILIASDGTILKNFSCGDDWNCK